MAPPCDCSWSCAGKLATLPKVLADLG